MDTRDISLAPHILLDGNWEDWVTRAMLCLVRPGMGIIEVGANIGWYTTLLAREMGPTGQLLAFEANPRLAEIAFRNLHVNGLTSHAEVHPKAVSDGDGTVILCIFGDYLADSSMFAGIARPFHPQSRQIAVPSTALDQSWERGRAVQLMKIDAEGAEPLVLRGAARMIADDLDLVIVLEHDPRMLSLAMPLDEFHGMLQGLALCPHIIGHDSSIRSTTWSELANRSNCDIVLRRRNVSASIGSRC